MTLSINLIELTVLLGCGFFGVLFLIALGLIRQAWQIKIEPRDGAANQ